jgi:hypothetical protein
MIDSFYWVSFDGEFNLSTSRVCQMVWEGYPESHFHHGLWWADEGKDSKYGY